jgi:hypothetical protein
MDSNKFRMTKEAHGDYTSVALPEGAGMSGETSNFEIARTIGAELPDVKVSAGKLGTALKLNGQILACEAINKSADPGSLMIRLGFERRDALMAENPAAFYLTGHYRAYPVVLVRLAEVNRDDLQALLAEALEFMQREKAAA